MTGALLSQCGAAVVGGKAGGEGGPVASATAAHAATVWTRLRCHSNPNFSMGIDFGYLRNSNDMWGI